MIDINELRRLAQAATPGGWYVARGNYVYGCKEVTDGEEVWHPVIACTDDDEVNINFEGNANFIAAANPAVINELLDRLEAAERSDAESVAMYRKARDERDELRVENETLAANLRGKHSTAGATYAHLIAERDALRAKVSDSAINVEYLGNLKKSYEEFIGKLQDERNDLQTELKEVRYRTAVAHDTIKALRAKIEAMEKQEPVAWLHESRRDSDVVTDAVKHVWGKAVVGALAAYSIPLYLAPGAQPASITPEGWKLVPIEPTPGMMRGAHRLVAAARRVLASADSQGLIRLDESGDVASELRSALEAAPEAKP